MGTWVENPNADQASAKQTETDRYRRREQEYKRDGNNKSHRSKEERTSQRKTAKAARKRNRK